MQKETGKNKGGRPYAGGRDRTSNLQIRLTPEEHERLTITARKSGLAVSELFRSMMLQEDMATEDTFITLQLNGRPASLTVDQAKAIYKQLTEAFLA